MELARAPAPEVLLPEESLAALETKRMDRETGITFVGTDDLEDALAIRLEKVRVGDAGPPGSINPQDPQL